MVASVDRMERRRRKVVGRERQNVSPSEALRAARKAARLKQGDIATALKVHPRTVTRWELGQTRPSKDEWTSIVSFLAGFAPDLAQRLAAVADVPSPVPAPPPVDLRAVEDALFRAADQLDVSPRRVREALRELFSTAVAAHASLGDLARAVQEKGSAHSPSPSELLVPTE